MTFDLHCDTIMRICDDKSELHTNTYHIDVNKLIKGDALAQCFAMFVDLTMDASPFEYCNDMIDTYDREIKTNEQYLRKAMTTADIEKNLKDGFISSILTIEEGGVIEGKMENFHHFADRGVKAITLTWNYENEIAYPNCKEAFRELGLKPFGIQLIKAMNERNVLIDVSHLSDGGFWDCIKYSKQPILATHSNARGCWNHSRNLTDDMIIALRDNGGVMGINFCSAFVNETNYTSIDDLIKQIDYIKNLAGVDVIALGSDFDGIESELELKDASYMPKLAQGLKEHGYTSEEVDKIFFKNAMRLFDK